MPTILITALAMLAFAANSLLGRAALLDDVMDPASFTYLRLISGAITLVVIHFLSRGKTNELINARFIAFSGIALFVYALCFSYAYTNIEAGMGALLLFGAVQLSMIGFYLVQGNKLFRWEWLGIAVASSGFVLLLLPSAYSPNILASSLMILSGVSWAIFTLLGKHASSARVGITQGFVGAGIIAMLASPWMFTYSSISFNGVMLALTSGVITSALGYVIWYYAVAKLTVLQASISQLSVPVIALWLGSLWLGESVSIFLILVSAMILGGIALVFLTKPR